MSDSRQAIAQALAAQAIQQPPPDPYQLNQVMEQQAAQNSPAMTNPVLTALMNKLGLFAALRNRRNQPLLNPENMPTALPQ
jgi:hypothetical protein